MSFESWKDKIDTFQIADVREAVGNFFPALKARAEGIPLHGGLLVIQTFEPIPLYEVLERLGFEWHMEKKADNEYHAYFYRTSVPAESGEMPLRPAALLHFPLIDYELADIAVRFWDLTWNDEKRHLPHEMRLLLALANAVGAGRMRQAARELIKAYIHGVDSAALDDVFELFVWNQGIGHFCSEIGPSALFAAYTFIKQSEKKGMPREAICQGLRENFGENHPDVRVV